MSDTTSPRPSARSFNHRLVMFIIGCLTLSQLRIISNFANSKVELDSIGAENEYKLQYIQNEKRKFAASKGLRDAADEKIPYLDDDAVDEVMSVPDIQQHDATPTTVITDDITAFCGSCMWNNTNINCDARVDFVMKRYPKENHTRDRTKQLILMKGFCVDPGWAPEFIDEDIAIAEKEVASIFQNRSADDVVTATAVNITNSSLLRISSSSLVNNTTTVVQKEAPPQSTSSSLIPIQNNSTAAIDLVSLTTNKDFFTLFNSSAITSWLRHIQNIQSITFIGPPSDHDLFQENMQIYYPQLVDTTISSRGSGKIPIRWVNETHWTNYKKKYRCPYIGVCQQLIKLFVFDLRTKMNIDIGNNVLILDSDTVWSRDVTFIHDDGTITYFEVLNHEDGLDCTGMDPVAFTEGITIGPLKPPVKRMSSNRTMEERTRLNTTQLDTVTPYSACRRAEYPNATGKRHISHHMLFQYDVMMHLHDTIKKAWSAPNIWQAFVKCHRQDFCKSRVSEYELYFSFISVHYPQRVHLESLENGVDMMLASAVCTADEMECCRKRGVLLKGCHDHRIDLMNNAKSNGQRVHAMGDMCC
eukprot:scaffold11014_cov137-Skeletonema_menzelii.AAC.3